jgi:hypothetical protein
VSGREAALWVIVALSATAVAGLAGAAVARQRCRALPGLPYLILAVAMVCGMWAAIGWAWLLTGGTVS